MLTIYYSGGHVIQPFEESLSLLGSAQPDSIFVLDGKGSPVSFSYLEEGIGDRGRPVVIQKGSLTDRGELLELTKNYVDYLIRTPGERSIVSRLFAPDRVYTQSLVQPQLRVQRKEPVQASYLVTDLRWHPVGSLVLGSREGSKMKFHLRIGGVIENETGSPIQAERITLVAGDMNIAIPNVQSRELRSRPEALAMATPFTYSAPPSGISSLEDFVRYSTEIREVRTVTPVELDHQDLEGFKLYLRDVRSQNTSFGYRLTIPKGVYLPAMKIQVYDREMGYLGAAAIPEKRGPSTVDLVLGDTTLLHIDPLVEEDTQEVEEKREDGATVRYTLRTARLQATFMNNTPEPVYVLLRYYIGDQTLDSVSCSELNHRSDGFLEGIFHIQPSEGPRLRKLQSLGTSEEPEPRHAQEWACTLTLRSRTFILLPRKEVSSCPLPEKSSEKSPSSCPLPEKTSRSPPVSRGLPIVSSLPTFSVGSSQRS